MATFWQTDSKTVTSTVGLPESGGRTCNSYKVSSGHGMKCLRSIRARPGCTFAARHSLFCEISLALRLASSVERKLLRAINLLFKLYLFTLIFVMKKRARSRSD